jgi:hypothetical protein
MASPIKDSRTRDKGLDAPLKVALQPHPSDWLPLAALGVGLLGFVVYVETRQAYDVFFSNFFVSLDDVGFSETRIIESAGVALSYLIVFLAVAVATSRIFSALAYEHHWPLHLRKFFGKGLLKNALKPEEAGEELEVLKQDAKKSSQTEDQDNADAQVEPPDVRERADTVGVVASFSAIVALRLLVRSLLGGTLVDLVTYRALYFLYLLAIIELGVWLATLSIERVKPVEIIRWLLVLSVVAFLVVLHFVIVDEAQRDADCIKSSGVPTTRLPLGVPVNFVNIEWNRRTLTDQYPADQTFVLLGSGKMLVFYDLAISKSVRVPSDSVTQMKSVQPATCAT